MFRSLALLALFSVPLAVPAQVQVASAGTPASLPELAAVALPDAPGVSSTSDLEEGDGQAGIAPNAGSANRVVAKKYAGIILPGQTAVPLTAREKLRYSFVDSFNPFALLGVTVSAGYSHLVDSAPHYGTNGTAFAKREGVSALRNTIQTITTDAVFSPMFHDDPRYYELGPSHKFFPRVVYAATRVVVTRSDSGANRINAPLLLGYGVAAGMNNLYYPDQDRGGVKTLQNYAGSLGGAALGFEVSEFLDDALHAFHIRNN